MHDSNDSDGPRKRARLSIPDKAQPEADIRRSVLTELNNLLGCEELTDLTDMEEIVT